MLTITSHHNHDSAADASFAQVRQFVENETRQQRRKKPSLNVAHLRCDAFCAECNKTADSQPTKPLHEFAALRHSMASVLDVFRAAPNLPSGDELRTCLAAGVQALDAIMPLVTNARTCSAVMQQFKTVRAKMSNAGMMASEWLCEALRDIVLEWTTDNALINSLQPGSQAARAFDYGYAQLYHSEKKLLLGHKERQRTCDALHIHTYLAPCDGCLAFMEAFATANHTSIVVSHSAPHANDVARRQRCPQRTMVPSVCWLGPAAVAAPAVAVGGGGGS